MIIVSASTLLCIAINLGKLTLLSIAMAQTMIMAGGTWIALRKLRFIQATPASHLEREPAGKTSVEICEKIPKCQSPILLLPHLPTGLAERLSSREPECLYKLSLITSKRGILWMIS